MAIVWLTYAWVDNSNNDVDYIAQELKQSGLEIKLDRWNIGAGLPLWDQIARFILDENESDAWLVYATQNSLGSEACREELRYALDRALNQRGEIFPVLALFPNSVDRNLIPPVIRVRLYVSLTDADWKERIKAAAEGRAPSISLQSIQPYFCRVYTPTEAHGTYVIELRPRAGTWSPFLIAIPQDEYAFVKPEIQYKAGENINAMGMPLFSVMQGENLPIDSVRYWFMSIGNEATPTRSYYIGCKVLPSKLLFGVDGGEQYWLEFKS